MNQLSAGSNVIVWGAFGVPGMLFPLSPASTGSEAPKRLATQLQKFVFPFEVVLIEPVGSAMAS